MATGDKIYIADKPTLDGVNTKVGTNADLAGTTTIFARVRQIYEYMVNTLLVAINGRQASWGAVAGTKTNIDNTAATVGTINTNVNTINTKIGASTDTGTTTLFGVVKNSGGTDWSKLTYGSSVRVNSTGLVRSVSSGKGYFSVIAHHGSGGTAQTITITVDGVVLMDGFLHRYSSVCVTPWIRYNSSYNVTITAGSSENSCRVLEGAE